MTSGPMRAGALPDDPDEDPRRDALRCIECEFRANDSPGGWYDLSDHQRQSGHRYEHVRPAPAPPTVADILAGQGAASLYLRRAGNGETELWFKRSDGVPFCMDILDGEDAGTEDFALRDHLAATLPTVHPTEETR